MAKIINGKRVSILSNVKAIYKNCYPHDKECDYLNENISFAQVLARMQEGEDFYQIIGINGFADSIVRERIFDILSVVGGVKYDDIYTLWLNADELRKNYVATIF